MDENQKNGISRRELIIELGKWSKAVGLLTVGAGAAYGLSACGGGGDSGGGDTTYCNVTYCNGCCHNYSTASEPVCYCNYNDYSDTCC